MVAPELHTASLVSSWSSSAVARQTRPLGAEHPDTQVTRFNLLAGLLQLRDLDAATVQIHALLPMLAADPASLSAVQLTICRRLRAILTSDSTG